MNSDASRLMGLNPITICILGILGAIWFVLMIMPTGPDEGPFRGVEIGFPFTYCRNGSNFGPTGEEAVLERNVQHLMVDCLVGFGLLICAGMIIEKALFPKRRLQFHLSSLLVIVLALSAIMFLAAFLLI